MARIPLAEVADMDPEQRAQYDRFPSNLTKTLLLLDRRLATTLPEAANALRASGLDPRLREGIIIRVAARTSSAYERMQHYEQALAQGWTAAEIDAIESGVGDALPPDFAAVLPFVDDAITGSSPSDDVLAAARAVLSDKDLVTVIVLVGHYLTVARLTGMLAVDLDAAPDPWTHEH